MRKKVYCVRTDFYSYFYGIHWLEQHRSKRPKALKLLALCPHGLVLQLQGKAVRDQGDEFRIRGFTLGVGDCVFLSFQNFFETK